MKWQNAILTLALILIIRVTSAGTVVFSDGGQLMVNPDGPLPYIGDATVTWHDCAWWTLYTAVCKATITQAGTAPIEAVQ